jgi:uncharacterized membrane protein YkoI
VLAFVTATMAANYISKAAAERIALRAVGKGSVVQAVLETEYLTRVWSVTIITTGYEYDVAVNAYTGKVMKLVRQSQTDLITQGQAEVAAMLATHGGPLPSGPGATEFVIASKLNDMDEGGKGWEVVVQTADCAATVAVQGETGVVTNIAQAMNRKLLTRAASEKLALAAVGGGKVILAALEMTDKPPHWSIDITAGVNEFEVWVDAYTGKILNIIRG